MCRFRSRCTLVPLLAASKTSTFRLEGAVWNSGPPHLRCSTEPAPWTCGVRRWFLGQFPRSPAAVPSRCRRASDPTGRLRSSPSSLCLYPDPAWLLICESDSATSSNVSVVVSNSERGSASEDYIRVIVSKRSSDWRTVSQAVASRL